MSTDPGDLDPQRKCAEQVLTLTQETCVNFAGNCRLSDPGHVELACEGLKKLISLDSGATITLVFPQEEQPLAKDMCVDPEKMEYFLQGKEYTKIEIRDGKVTVTKYSADGNSEEIPFSALCPEGGGSSSSSSGGSGPR